MNWVAIAFGIIGCLVGLVSLYLAWRANKTAQSSYKTAQEALDFERKKYEKEIFNVRVVHSIDSDDGEYVVNVGAVNVGNNPIPIARSHVLTIISHWNDKSYSYGNSTKIGAGYPIILSPYEDYRCNFKLRSIVTPLLEILEEQQPEWLTPGDELVLLLSIVFIDDMENLYVDKVKLSIALIKNNDELDFYIADVSTSNNDYSDL